MFLLLNLSGYILLWLDGSGFHIPEFSASSSKPV